MSTSSIVQKLWNYCNVLRDDGLSYGVEDLRSALEQFEAIAEDVNGGASATPHPQP